MAYRSLKIEGLRGFACAQTLELAVPNGKDSGSGLTIVVGENNSGKSTVIEALRSFSFMSVSFPEGERNKGADERVNIALLTDDGEIEIATLPVGGSEVKFNAPDHIQRPLRIVALPSRRNFEPLFNSQGSSRDSYALNIGQTYKRGGTFSAIVGRLVTVAQSYKDDFDKVLSKLIYPVPEWFIDRINQNAMFIKIRSPGGHRHSSEGAGEGLFSLFCIADALYDSRPGDLIAIDEPELSLHPAVLRRLSETFGEYSKDRQIVIATHSTYFADPRFLCSGAKLCRVVVNTSGSTIAQIKSSTADKLRSFLENKNNPHVLGLDAREIFFQSDRVILVEGQEDVVFYPDVEKELGLEFEGNFFGWGVGGADNMGVFANLLQDLSFAKVVGILDGDQEEVAAQLRQNFPDYLFLTIPADDIRTKEARPETPKKVGLLDGGALRDEFKPAARAAIEKVNHYLLN